MRYGVVILAAGRSTRMKYPKPFLAVEDSFFLKKIIETYSAIVDDICVVFNSDNFRLFMDNFYFGGNFKIILNTVSQERFFSIYTGVNCLKSDNYLFIQNVDNPSVSADVLKKLIGNKDKASIIQPVAFGRRGHPILINKIVINQVFSASDFSQNFREFLKQFSKFDVIINDKSVLENLNTPDDYKRYINSKKK